ncbi:MAG: response regulator [Acidobacteriota bacterium]
MGKRILLADDSITIQKVVELTFSDGDFDVLSVGSGDQAITKAREFKPDIALLDVIMPEKNGYEVCQVLKQDSELSHIPVLLLTGTFESFDRARAEEVGADGYLTKPFESQMLISKVEELLASAPRQVSASAQDGTIPNVKNPAAGESTTSAAAPETPPQDAALPPEPPPQEPPPPPEQAPQEVAPAPQPVAEPAPPAPPAGPVAGAQHSAGPETTTEAEASSPEPVSPIEPVPPPMGADVPPPDLPAAGEPAPEPPQTQDRDEIMMADEGPPPPPADSLAGEEPAPPVEAVPPVAEPASADSLPPAETTSGDSDSYESTFVMPGEPETIALSGPRPAEDQGPGTLYPGPASEPAPAAAPTHTLTPEQLDEIVRRVVGQLSDQVMREVAWEVIPDLAEILIRKRISELERDGEPRG